MSKDRIRRLGAVASVFIVTAITSLLVAALLEGRPRWVAIGYVLGLAVSFVGAMAIPER